MTLWYLLDSFSLNIIKMFSSWHFLGKMYFESSMIDPFILYCYLGRAVFNQEKLLLVWYSFSKKLKVVYLAVVQRELGITVSTFHCLTIIMKYIYKNSFKKKFYKRNIFNFLCFSPASVWLLFNRWVMSGSVPF